MRNILSVFKTREKFKDGNFFAISSEVIYLILLFIVPLYFSVFFPTNNVFELSKLFVFKALVLLLLFVNIVWFLKGGLFFKKEDFFVLKKFLLWPFIFFLGMGLSLIFSNNITQSFFGSYDRQSGYLSYLYYFLFFILLFFNLAIPFLKKEKEIAFKKIKRLLLSLVFSGLIASVYGILQRLGIDFLIWPEDPLITKRVFSTLGQANFLASWLLFVIPLTAYFIWKEKNNLKKFLFVLIVILQIICLFLTASRGGLIAFILMILFFSFWFIKRSSETILKKSLFIFLIFTTIFCCALFLEKSFPGRLSSLSNWEGGSMAVRLDFYQAAFEAWKQKPLFGYGLENAGEVFIAAYQPDWGVHSNVGVYNDRAHNLFLDIILNGGLFLLFIFLSFYIYLIRLFLHSFKLSESKKDFDFLFLFLALGFGMGAYLISLLFNFSFVSGEIYFFALVSVLSAMSVSYLQTDYFKIEKKQERISTKKGFRIFLFFVFSASILFLFSYEFSVFKADNYFYKTNYYLKRGEYLLAVESFSKIEELNINPLNKSYYQRLIAEGLSEHYLNNDKKEMDVWAKEFLSFIFSRFSKNQFSDLVVAGKIEAALGREDSARLLWQEAANLSPYWPRTYMEIARSFRRSNLWADALAYNSLSLSILPSIDNPYLNEDHRKVLQLYRQSIFKEMGLIYFSLGDFSKAEEYFREAYSANVYEIVLLKNIADTYYLRSDISKALDLVLHGASRSPYDYNWFLSAAFLFEKQGEQEEAKKYLNRTQELFPKNLIWPY